MKTNEILEKNPVKRFLAISIGAFAALCGTLSAQAQTVYSVNIVGCVPERTTYLLTAPMTVEQRQTFHAQTFNQLPPSARALYLRVVAYDVGTMICSDGESLSSAALAEYMKNAFDNTGPANIEWFTLAHKAAIKEAMRELNVLIADQVANNPAYEQAMEAGAVDSIFDEIEDFEQ